jgi:hypothetical protein
MSRNQIILFFESPLHILPIDLSVDCLMLQNHSSRNDLFHNNPFAIDTIPSSSMLFSLRSNDFIDFECSRNPKK